MTNFEVLHKKMLDGEKIVLPVIRPGDKVSFTVTDTSGYTAEKMANDTAKAIAKYYLKWAKAEAEEIGNEP